MPGSERRIVARARSRVTDRPPWAPYRGDTNPLMKLVFGRELEHNNGFIAGQG